MNVRTPPALAEELKKSKMVAKYLDGESPPPPPATTSTGGEKKRVSPGDEDNDWDGTPNPSFSGLLEKVPPSLFYDPQKVMNYLNQKLGFKLNSHECSEEELFPVKVELTDEQKRELSQPPAQLSHDDRPARGGGTRAAKPKFLTRTVAAKDPTAPCLRIVCISDTHSMHSLIDPQLLPPGDVLVHAGDFSDTGKEAEVDEFVSWLQSLGDKYKHKVVIAGNHDLSLDPASYKETWKRFGHKSMCDPREQIAKLRAVCTYLDHEAAVIEGVKFFGSPYQPWFYDWAFNLSRVGECRAKWETIPSDTDVLITHGPPLGHGDYCVPPGGSGHAGCADLLDWCLTFKPKLHIFGHIHEGYGVTRNKETGTVFVNASTSNVQYDPNNLNRPLVWDLPLPLGKSEETSSPTTVS